MGQPDTSRFKQLQVTTPVAAPADSPSSTPQFTLSPIAVSRMPTTGFLFNIKILPASTAVGPFSVTPWVRDPITGFWGAGQIVTGLAERSMMCCYDVDASELWFQVTSAVNGAILLLVAEQ